MVSAMLALGFVLAPLDGLEPEVLAAIEEAAAPWKRNGVPGGVIGVVKDGELIFAQGYGMANLETQTPMTVDSALDVGSVSKMFTSATIHKLAAEGKLSLDDDIHKYVPELPDFGHNITLRHLMHHTSGLRDYLNMTIAQGRAIEALSEDDVLTLMARQKDLNFAPSEGFMYCNTGYFLLGLVAKRVTNTSLNAAAKEHVFGPLGMEHTVYDDQPSRIIIGRADSYAAPLMGWAAQRASIGLIGDGGLVTTVGDLAKWCASLHDDDLGIVAAMVTPTHLVNGTDVPYGTGLFLDELKGEKRVQHGGAWLGFRAQVSWFPRRNVAVITMSNDGSANAPTINDAVATAVLDLAEPETNAPADAKISEADAKPLLGTYALQGVPIKIEFTYEDGVLHGQPTGQPKLALKPVGEREFEIVGVEAKIVFAEPVNGECPKITLHQGGATIEGLRGEGYSATDEARAAWVGKYYSEELETTYELVEADGRLRFLLNGDARGYLTLTDAKTGTWGNFLTITLEEGGFRVDAGGRASRLWFARQD